MVSVQALQRGGFRDRWDLLGRIVQLRLEWVQKFIPWA